VDTAVAALEAADIRVGEVTTDSTYDAVLQVLVDDRPFTIPLEVVSYCTRQRAEELIARHGPPRIGVFPLVVADKVTAEARTILNDAGWSWLDRRGRLHLRAPAVRVDVDVPREERSTFSGQSGPPITGRGGINVAYWLCDHPGEALSPTRSAAALGLAPSTISTAVRRLVDAGLVDDDGTGLFPELFWELAGVWRTDRAWLNTAPDPAVHLTADSYASTWRRTGTAAAAAYGAPVVSSEGGPVELYVPGPVAISVALRRYGAAEPGAGAAVLAVAPASPVTAGLGDDHVAVVGGWPAAPVLAVALDLAQDRARGREILADWRASDAVWL
jgi:DNA-binding transcriptional ArsR family regulator